MRKSLFTLTILVLITACNAGTRTDEKSTSEEIVTQQPEQIEAQKPSQVETLTFDFEESAIDALPEGWSAHFTGHGHMPAWKVVEYKGNKVLAQLSSDQPNNHFNVTVYDKWQATDMVLSIRLKGVQGKIDQGGGFVWRFQDADNYYIVRSNPLEDNVVLYKVKNGKRTDLPLVGKGRTYGVDVPPLGNGWNTLKLVVKGDIFTVFLNEEELFKVQDTTFTEAGKVGLWTKADAVTYFDDFKIEND